MATEEALTQEYETEHGTVKLSPGIIRKYLTHGQGNVSDQEIVMFISLCRYQKLNPFLNEAYLIKYSNDTPATLIVGKETFTKRAEKHHEFDGMQAGIYVQKTDKVEQRIGTLILPGERLVGGWAKVFRKGWSVPIEISVSFEEYQGKKKDGTVTRQWERMPATMIRKVALVQALREAFPDQFQGMYDSSEIQSVEAPNYKVYSEEPEVYAGVPKKEAEKPKEKTEDYKKLEQQILNDINHEDFKGKVILDGKEITLEYYKKNIPEKLKGKILSMQRLQYIADYIARMLLAAQEQPKQEYPSEPKEEPSNDELFDAPLEELERDGNLST